MKILLAAAVLLVLALLALVVQPFTGTGPPWPGPGADAARLSAHVRELVALGPRDDAPGQARAAAWVRAQLISLGYQPVVQGYRWNGADFVNVIATAGPAGGEGVVVSAHFDARGPFPGADDDASGVAGLLELARMLRARPPPVRTELAFYSNEEYGLAGSAAHARSLDPRSVRAMVSLEMIGCFTGPQRFPFAAVGLLYPHDGRYIVVVARPRDALLTRSLKRALRGSGRAESINAPLPDSNRSDHASFWRAGVPAAMITDTANYRNPRYHSAADTPDTLDYAGMAQVIDGLAAWVSEVPR